MEKRFSGKTAVVTGGASGIGRQTALDLAAQGANVLIATRKSEQAAQEVVAQINALGVESGYVLCDVAIEADVQHMVKTAVDRFGRIDIAFNNAGIGADGVTMPRLPIAQLPAEDWDLVSDTNLKGLFLCMKHELKQMLKQGVGCIVTTASSAGLKPMADFGAYGPSKAGAIMLTKMVALENRDKGIRANVVCPGPTLGTALAERTFGAYRPEDGLPLIGDTGVRTGHVSDVSAVVCWLCSDQCSHVNGNVITIDGGLDIM